MGNISSVLKAKRKELGLTLAQIAEKIGVTEATVQRWESGNIKSLRHERIAKLADILGVTPSVLMGWDEPTAPTLPSPTITEDAELNEYLEILRTRPEMKMMFQLAKGATKEDVEKAVRVIEAMFGKDTKGD